jgi:cullin 4
VSKQIIDLPPEVGKSQCLQLYLLSLNLQMLGDLASFVAYYKTKHSAHVLDWDHALGSMTMKGRFKPGVKELSLSLYQGIILLLFNEETEWRFQDIKDRTRLGKLLSLASRMCFA